MIEKTEEEILQERFDEEERRERVEHDSALKNIRAILGTPYGKNFIKYLFVNLEVGVLPEIGAEGVWLHDRLGFLRSGNQIFKLIAEADPDNAAKILAEIEKERYEVILRTSQTGRS